MVLLARLSSWSCAISCTCSAEVGACHFGVGMGSCRRRQAGCYHATGGGLSRSRRRAYCAGTASNTIEAPVADYTPALVPHPTLRPYSGTPGRSGRCWPPCRYPPMPRGFTNPLSAIPDRTRSSRANVPARATAAQGERLA